MSERMSGAQATDESRAAAHVGSGETLYEIRDLKKHFPLTTGIIFRKQVGAVHAVDGVSFDVKRGETLGLVGESGCGKSTTGRLLLRLLDPTSGSIKFEGEEIAGIKPKQLVAFRRDAQMIFQDPYSSLNPRKTVGSIIGEPFSIHNMKTGEGERRKAVQELMDTVGLNPEHYNRYPHEFSGGQRQRIGVARAIALKPKLIVADEPVSALDVSIQAQVLNLLRELQRDLGLTLIFIAHDLSVVRHMCDRVAVMYLGRIVELASSDQLYGHPRMPYTGALMSAVPIADPKLAAAKKRQILAGDVPSPTNPPPACRFHTRCWKAQDICRQDDPPLEAEGRRQPRRLPLPADRRRGRRAGPDHAPGPRLSAVDRFRAALAARGVEVEPRVLPDSARTAPEAAAAVGVEVGAIVKSLVFRCGDEAVLALVSGANRADEARLVGGVRRAGGARPTPISRAPRPGSRSAACRRSATPRRCGRSSTRTCCASTSCGPRRARRTRSSRSRPPSWPSSPAAAWSASPSALAEPRQRAVPARADVLHPGDRVAERLGREPVAQLAPLALRRRPARRARAR